MRACFRKMLSYLQTNRQLKAPFELNRRPQIAGEKAFLRNAKHAAIHIIAVYSYDIRDAILEKATCPCANAAACINYAFEGEQGEYQWDNNRCGLINAAVMALVECAVIGRLARWHVLLLLHSQGETPLVCLSRSLLSGV